MKILLTGGATGGHFYPLIAVAEEIREVAHKEKLLAPKIYYMANSPYNSKVLFDQEIEFVHVAAGKKRINPQGISKLLNFIDIFKMGFGVLTAIVKMYFIMPDVIFAKGGFVSYPALRAGKFFNIPIIIHESDSVPGRVSKWAGKFAVKVAVSYKEASEFFDQDKVAYTGNPVRQEINQVLSTGAKEYLGLEDDIPVVFVMGGSSGAKIINNVILSSLPKLVEKYQIIHQTGKTNFQEVKRSANVILENSSFKTRYRPYDYLNSLSMRMSAGASNVIVSRGGSTIFEIALWGVPSIIIPITDSNGDHQRKNAYNFARSGGCVVIEEANLTPEILLNEVDRIIRNVHVQTNMKEGMQKFARPDAAKLIAKEILKIALGHEIV
ncbi:MAG: UDP-N-acetylglucosamine--N-acetylmuramyl-(pentapeptide) pyrophosphoryl-undecaprenol N-acetylglucosamine transferase [bacterium]